MEELIERAKAVLPVFERQMRRPYVVEITGTPKAGKSTGIRKLAALFTLAGWQVHVVRESAESCPIAMKGHFFFNTWTTCTLLRELVDVVDSDHHLVILDRGLFDALIWLRLQSGRGQVSREEAQAFEGFVRLDRWWSREDMVIVLRASPETAMEREGIAEGGPRRGSIMHPDVLQELNETIDALSSESAFHVDVDERAQDAVVEELAALVLDGVQSFVDQPIAVLPRSAVEAAFGENLALTWKPSLYQSLVDDVSYLARSEAEESDDVVQVVAAGIPTAVTEPDSTFVFERSAKGPSARRYGRHTLWKGVHASKAGSADDLADGIRERFRDDLYLAALDTEPSPLGLVWTPKKEPRHLGVVFEVPIEAADIVEHLREKSFKTKGRLDGIKLSLHTLHDLRVDEGIDLESWSKCVLEKQWLERHK